MQDAFISSIFLAGAILCVVLTDAGILFKACIAALIVFEIKASISDVKEIQQLNKKIIISIYYKLKKMQEKKTSEQKFSDSNDTDDFIDSLFFDVLAFSVERGTSVSSIQKHFSISHSRAEKIVDQMSRVGLCRPSKGNSSTLEMLITMEEVEELRHSSSKGNSPSYR